MISPEAAERELSDSTTESEVSSPETERRSRAIIDIEAAREADCCYEFVASDGSYLESIQRSWNDCIR